MIRNKKANEITSIGKWKNEDKTKKAEEIYIPPENRQQIIDDLKLFWALNVTPLYRNGISRICKIVWHNFWW